MLEEVRSGTSAKSENSLAVAWNSPPQKTELCQFKDKQEGQSDQSRMRTANGR